MAAYSISFDNTLRRPWDKRRAVEGTLAPNTNQVVEIRVADGAGGLKHGDVMSALEALVDRMREQRQPRT